MLLLPLLLGAVLLCLSGPLPAAPPAGAAPVKMEIYLLMGQSNMAGRDRSRLAQQVDDKRIMAWTAEGTWVVARDPLHQQDGRTEPGEGPGLSFAREMLKAQPETTIGLVPCAVGGTPLKRWQKKGGDLYERALARARQAAAAGEIKGVLWLQGESDAEKQPWADRYEGGLAGLIRDLREDLGLRDLPVVVGQIGEFLAPERYVGAEKVRAAIRAVSEKVPNVGYADSAGLKDKGDKLHYDADSAHEMGVRFARAMQDLRRKAAGGKP